MTIWVKLLNILIIWLNFVGVAILLIWVLEYRKRKKIKPMEQPEVVYTRIVEGYLFEMLEGNRSYGFSINGNDLSEEIEEFEGKLVSITIEELKEEDNGKRRM